MKLHITVELNRSKERHWIEPVAEIMLNIIADVQHLYALRKAHSSSGNNTDAERGASEQSGVHE